jgi:hypothetical protein
MMNSKCDHDDIAISTKRWITTSEGVLFRKKIKLRGQSGQIYSAERGTNGYAQKYPQYD